MDLAITDTTPDQMRSIGTFKLTSQGLVPVVKNEPYTSFLKFNEGERKRADSLLPEQKQSLNAYISWMGRETIRYSWDFLKDWDKELRNQIQENTVASFNPVLFRSAYEQYIDTWLLNSKNKNKSIYAANAPFKGEDYNSGGCLLP